MKIEIQPISDDALIKAEFFLIKCRHGLTGLLPHWNQNSVIQPLAASKQPL
jgi:hypothetical protein